MNTEIKVKSADYVLIRSIGQNFMTKADMVNDGIMIKCKKLSLKEFGAYTNLHRVRCI